MRLRLSLIVFYLDVSSWCFRQPWQMPGGCSYLLKINVKFANSNLLWVQSCYCLWAWLCREVVILDWFIDFSHQKSQKPTWLFASHTNTNSACHLIILTILTWARDVWIPVVVSRLRNKASMHFLYFIAQLRLFLRVVILVVGAHSSPRE